MKQARNRAHREMLAGASLSAVADATLVVVNPTHLATALKYDEHANRVPRVIAQGAGELARKVIAAAYRYGVPVVRDVAMARELAKLEVDQEIPEALYEAVAMVLREVLPEGKAR